MSVPPTSELMYLKGVGPGRAEILAKRGIRTFEDLLGYLPFRYEDRIHFAKIRDIAPGRVYTVRAQVLSGSLVRYSRAQGGMYHLLVRDETGSLPCKFFHGQYLEKTFKPGQDLVLHGKADLDPMRPGRIEMTNPAYELLEGDGADSTEVGRIVPIYEAIGGIGARTMRRIVYQALEKSGDSLLDPLPAEILERHNFPSRRDAIRFVHFPPRTESVEALNSFRSAAHLRLIFEEFFFYQLSVAMRKKSAQQQAGIAFRVREPAIREAIKQVLPFKPTGAQKRALAEIAGDLERGIPMNRLLQGDVGSGKTIVALETATIVIENGYQAALMAPTEILAVQHSLAAQKVFARAGYRVELLISGLKTSDKKAALDRIRSGESQLVVGTHALLEPQVEFKRLGLVIVDEQHRFGVLQRKELMEKGAAPDVLVMTATPIPRTLSLTLYGDLDVSVIDEMPPGRVPIVTRVSSERESARRLGFLETGNRGWPAGLRRLSGDRAVEICGIAALAEGGHRGVRAAAQRDFSQSPRGPAARTHEERGKRKSNGRIPPPRNRYSGGDHGDRGGSGRAQRNGNGDRTRQPLRPFTIAPASRAHRARRRKRHVHPHRSQKSRRGCAGAPGNHGANHQRFRDRRNRFKIARPWRIFRHAATRRTRFSHCQSNS